MATSGYFNLAIDIPHPRCTRLEEPGKDRHRRCDAPNETRSKWATYCGGLRFVEEETQVADQRGHSDSHRFAATGIDPGCLPRAAAIPAQSASATLLRTNKRAESVHRRPKRPLSNPDPDQGEQDDSVVLSTTSVGAEGLEPPTSAL